MEQVQWSTPNKNGMNRHSGSPSKSPTCHRTPTKQNDARHKQTTYQNCTGGFTVLPNHITPPSGFTKFIARNPFDANLTNRLHLSVISPTIFSKVASPLQDSPSLVWSVDELAIIKPAKIEESPVQQLFCSDPEIEIKAQAAINQFFNTKQILPSPWDLKRKEKKLEMSTPTRPQEDLNSTKDSHKSKRDSYAQTVLSLPPKLPLDLEEALKPYFTFTQEQHSENDEANLSNSSLRRKLFFSQEDSPEDERYSSMSLSPVKSHGSMDFGVNSSPTQSGMLQNGHPLGTDSQKVERNHGTPMANSGNLSPLNMSPIHNNISDMSCQSIKSRVSRSVARLDFTTDMSIEVSMITEKQTDLNNESNISTTSCRSTLGTSMLSTELNSSAENSEQVLGNEKLCERTRQNETVEMILLGHKTPPVTSPVNKLERHVCLGQREDNKDCWNVATEWCKVHSHEQQCNTHTISDQQSTLNFAQDTGYQTYSMNGTSVTESINVTPTKQKIHLDEKIIYNDEELHLSDWKKNLINIYSSTPSKNRAKDN
ncbi:protein aurora borealis [Athalia rosae]|uniref:protein aurora borealis n=1 Tax=Athalia rosae TaxID=37344 RepID=UPI002033995A|nr:protein aurora borealis [Athalia rosae]XP_048508337.1 protein aurora borealis [Athalia rosae]